MLAIFNMNGEILGSILNSSEINENDPLYRDTESGASWAPKTK